MLKLSPDAAGCNYSLCVVVHDDRNNASPLSNIVSFELLDVQPPGRVGDLSVAHVDHVNRVAMLTWTAVGDDGLLGKGMDIKLLNY